MIYFSCDARAEKNAQKSELGRLVLYIIYLYLAYI